MMMVMMMMIMIAGFVDSISTPIKCWLEQMMSSSAGDDHRMMSIKEVDNDREEECCIVCLSLVGTGDDRFAVLERCGHGFHVDCVEAWLKEHPNCPLCRTPADHKHSHSHSHSHRLYLKKSYDIITRAALRLMDTIATCLTSSFTHHGLHSSLSHSCTYL